MTGTVSSLVRLVLVLGALCLTSASKLTVSNLEREVDLTTQGLVVASVLAIKNKEKQPLSSFVYCASKIVSGKTLLWIDFEEGDSSTDENLKKLEWTLNENECMEVALSSSLPAKGETTVEIYEIFSMNLVPVSKTIYQSETQLVKFSDFDVIVRDANLEIEKQTTKFYLPSKTVEDYTEVKPSKRDGGELSYGPYKASDASKDSAVTLIFENPEAMLLVESVVRDVTVSSWTDIEVEEHYHIKNVGPAFKEGFNRVEYSRNPQAYITESFALELPKQAHSLFFKDVLGNITTSHTRFESTKVTVQAVPRFPLVGGWQTHFTFGYKLPVSPFLRSNGKMSSEKTLVMDILPALQQVYVKNLTINTAVPEFSTEIKGAVQSTNAFFKASDPFRTVKTLKGKKNHYFDLSGRPVHTMQISEVAPELADVAELQYYVTFVFHWKYYLKEPMMVVVFAGFLALLFLLPSLDFRLVRKQKSD